MRSTAQQTVVPRRSREEEYPGGTYVRITDDQRDAPRGTAIFAEHVLYGYPHIGRILRLQSGLREQFGDNPFQVEEKVDGYNVRIARIGDAVLAFTRGGFVCPFTTDRLADFIDLRLFQDRPELVVCAEVAGPEQPYVAGHPPHILEDVCLQVFDFMRLDHPGFLPGEEQAQLLQRYALPAVEHYGRHDAGRWEEVRDLLWRLHLEGREGVVFKEEAPGAHRTKYVTGASCVDDIRATADNMLQLPSEYFTGRILRLALFMEDQGVERLGAVREALGRALVDGLLEAIERFRRERRVFHTHRCRFRHREAAERMLRHLKRADGHIQVVERGITREGDFHVLEFDKTYSEMTGLLGHLLRGGMVYD
jgi:putative ATP-dependent DNA ligase